MRCATVITTIREPEACRNWHNKDLIVVGDDKTPAKIWPSYVDYLSPMEQNKRWPELSRALPLNHYARKSLGYLRAVERGFDHVFETDDDNHPLFNCWDGLISLVPKQWQMAVGNWVNIFEVYCKDSNVWPRGYPPSHANDAVNMLCSTGGNMPVIQFMCDCEPDRDAMHRIAYPDMSWNFAADKPGTALAPGSWCPWNTQSTWWKLAHAEEMYIPAFTAFRVCDIARAYVFTPDIWTKGFTVGFAGPTVFQRRNEHDLVTDLRSEFGLYVNCERAAAMQHNSLQERMSLWSHDVERELYCYGLFLKELASCREKA